MLIGLEGVGPVVNADVEEACPAFDDTQPTGVPQQEGGDHEDPANEDVDLETELPGQTVSARRTDAHQRDERLGQAGSKSQFRPSAEDEAAQERVDDEQYQRCPLGGVALRFFHYGPNQLVGWRRWQVFQCPDLLHRHWHDHGGHIQRTRMAQNGFGWSRRSFARAVHVGALLLRHRRSVESSVQTVDAVELALDARLRRRSHRRRRDRPVHGLAVTEGRNVRISVVQVHSKPRDEQQQEISPFSREVH